MEGGLKGGDRGPRSSQARGVGVEEVALIRLRRVQNRRALLGEVAYENGWELGGGWWGVLG